MSAASTRYWTDKAQTLGRWRERVVGGVPEVGVCHIVISKQKSCKYAAYRSSGTLYRIGQADPGEKGKVCSSSWAVFLRLAETVSSMNFNGVRGRSWSFCKHQNSWKQKKKDIHTLYCNFSNQSCGSAVYGEKVKHKCWPLLHDVSLS